MVVAFGLEYRYTIPVRLAYLFYFHRLLFISLTGYSVPVRYSFGCSSPE